MVAGGALELNDEPADNASPSAVSSDGKLQGRWNLKSYLIKLMAKGST